MTKSRPRKSAMVRGSLVRPHTKRRKRERSVLDKDSITSQNHWASGADASIPLYVATDFKRCRGMSGLPHTCGNTRSGWRWPLQHGTGPASHQAGWGGRVAGRAHGQEDQPRVSRWMCVRPCGPHCAGQELRGQQAGDAWAAACTAAA